MIDDDLWPVCQCEIVGVDFLVLLLFYLFFGLKAVSETKATVVGDQTWHLKFTLVNKCKKQNKAIIVSLHFCELGTNTEPQADFSTFCVVAQCS